MAYAAISSLMYTLEQLLKPNQSFVCRSCTQQHLQSIYHNFSAMQLFLEDTTTKDIETLKVIEKRIREVVYKAEDRVDSTLRRIIVADREDKRQKACTSFYEELLKVEEQVYFLNKEVMLIDFNKLGSRSAELATTSSSSEKSRIEENSVVGMEDDYNTILDRLIAQTDELIVIPIFGMGGIDESKHPDWPTILDPLSILADLETLHLRAKQTIDQMIFSVDIFPPGLKQLKLTGIKIPWEVMNLLANLPNLEVLKVCQAFKGTEWKLNEDVVFHKLKYLLLNKCGDLQRWEAAGSDNFPVLEQLILHRFYELEEIPESIGEIMTLKLIEMDYCCSAVEKSARRIQQNQESLGNYVLQLQMYNSGLVVPPPPPRG